MSQTSLQRLRAAVAVVVAVLVAGGLMAAPAAYATTPKRSAIVTLTSVKAAASPVVVGTRVTVSGKTSSNLKGKVVVLQRKVGTKWVDQAAKARVTSARTFTITTRASGVDHVAYRVIYKGNSKIKSAKSYGKALTVYRWKHLSKLDPKIKKNTYSGPVSVNGKDYLNSLRMVRNNYFRAYASFDTKRKCLTFEATAGTPDTNPISGKTIMSISHDGNLVTSQEVRGGTSYRITQNIKNVLEIHIEREQGEGYLNDLALGDARILCRF